MTETHHSSQPRQTYHHGHLHEVLVKKGLEMARSGGTEAVVLREATRRAGVSPNAAYRHFANREALLDEVGLAAADQIGVVMREAVAEAQPIDDESVAVSQLVAACRAYLDFALTVSGPNLGARIATPSNHQARAIAPRRDARMTSRTRSAHSGVFSPRRGPEVDSDAKP